jgi:glycosyltransferase involved in cell wall biosynthesis
LFYGLLIPLHGLSTILAGAKRAPDLEWHLIGSGQQEELLRQQSALPNLLWDRWVPYDQLTNAIADAGVCLGVFGMSEKAGAVIPNKVYQILASGRALVTRDGPGIRELVSGAEPGIRLVPPGDPDALVASVRELLVSGEVPLDSYADRVGPDAILAALEPILDGVVEAKASQARRR